MERASSIGVDIGALFVKAVRLNAGGEISTSFYERHHGRPGDVLEEALDFLDVTPKDPVCLTGCNAEFFAKSMELPYRDVTLCQLEAVRRHVRDVRYIMDIGGGSATLIQLDEQGKFQSYSSNSLCAAGTGSFLDEQAGRLGISYQDASAFLHNPDPPTIAARCTVFAKSDLIHRQQEGCSRMDMWSGLCRGMTRTLLGTLLSGRPLDGKTAVIGGVALNAEVMRWLDRAYPGLITVPDNPQLMAAVGAAFGGKKPKAGLLLPVASEIGAGSKFARFPWPLTMEKSKYPSFATAEDYEDGEGNEVRVTAWEDGRDIEAFMGVDIGSTSTKLILIDRSRRVVADIYRKTAGDPLGATKLLFRALRELAGRKRSGLTILGAGTTGSGRRIVGSVIGADAVVNEITAHVAGAYHTDPAIDTIFEIGGQDSKYMHMTDGHIRDANMNYVCAAGTGSFVEEQAHKLGYKVSEAGPAVIGVCPPRATDRCTVFMEQDMSKLTQNGATPQEAFAAVMVSVTKNYLNKVVGNRYRSRERIFFQGATARNPALVAAFERLLNVEIVVSPYCHVMGALGVALITLDAIEEASASKSTFRGLDLEEREISLRKETCELCQNHCAVTFADIAGEVDSPSWGYMCGREPGEKKMRVSPHSRLLRLRRKMWLEAGRLDVPPEAPVVGIPQALTLHTYLPLWRRFFNRLGYAVRLSGSTDRQVRETGGRMSGAEFCFPAKVFLGHAASLAADGGVDFLFLPQMKNEEENENASNSTFCPYAQASPAYTKAAFRLNGIEVGRILSPLIDMRLGYERAAKRLVRHLSGPLGRTKRQIEAAWKDAYRVQRDFERRCREEGGKLLAESQRGGGKVLVLVGRPYNLYDLGLNLNLPEKLAEQGRAVLPLDCFPVDLAKLGRRYRNTYWGYGQKILAVLEDVAANDRLDAVYFTNFSCGPDSFLLTYAQEILGAKPFLALELDEHGSDTGYLTRIEAFFDVLGRPRKASPLRRELLEMPGDLRDHVLWIPNMHPFTTSLIAAALRAHGYRAKPLPLETEETFEVGRASVRGSECLPTALTIGSLLAVLRRSEKGERNAFFMPTARGPCRFGQYASLHRQILDREGFSSVPILSPSSANGYQGLDEPVRRTMWKAMVVGDVLMKAGCRVRPYEARPGDVNYVLEQELTRLCAVVERHGDVERAVLETVRALDAVPLHKGPRKPLVGVVGEIYVRNNFFANENVVRSIEKLGAEVWMAPLSEWVLFSSSVRNALDHQRSRFSKAVALSFVKYHWMLHWERKLYAAAGPLLSERHEPPLDEVLSEGERVLTDNVGGEAILTVGRAVRFARNDGASLVVNVAPFTCMPGTITTAVFRQLSVELDVPIVNMFYDGTGGQNRRLEVYLRTAMESAEHDRSISVKTIEPAMVPMEDWLPSAVDGPGKTEHKRS